MNKLKRTTMAVMGSQLLLLGALAGGSWAAFEQEHPGARAAGLGGAFCAVADDADCLSYNPAGLGRMQVSAVSFNYAKLLTGLNDGSNLADSQLAYLQPITETGALGVHWSQRSLAALYQENLYALAFGQAFDPQRRYLAGGTVKLLQQNYLETEVIAQNPVFAGKNSVLGFGVDLGGLVYLDEAIRVGMSLANINQPNMALGAGDSVVPFKARVGAAYQYQALLGTAEGAYFDGHYRISAGAENWWFDKRVAARVGYGFGDQELSELTLGLSVRLLQDSWLLQLDYAFVNPFGDFAGAGGTHQLDLTLFFGSAVESEETAKARRWLKAGDEARVQGKSQEALTAYQEAAEILKSDHELAAKIIALRREIRRQNEAEGLVARGLELEKSSNYLSAAAAYRKALALAPDDTQIGNLLRRVEEKIRAMSQRQKDLQTEKEKKQQDKIEQQNEKRAAQALEKAEEAWKKLRRNPRLWQRYADEVSQLEDQLREAKANLARHESEEASAQAQEIQSDAARVEQRFARDEASRIRKAVAERKEEAAAETVAPPAAEAPAAASVPPADNTNQQDQAKLHKRARGAYGRAVKIMLDIDRLNGPKYYAARIGQFKNELARIKALLEKQEYTGVVGASEKIFPELQKLKEDCEAKEKASRAVPANW